MKVLYWRMHDVLEINFVKLIVYNTKVQSTLFGYEFLFWLCITVLYLD